MKAKLLLVFFSLLVAFPLAAQNRWGIMGGANFSTTSAEGFKWRAGGYIGSLYDIRLNDSWYIQPQLLFTYEENDSKDKTKVDAFF